MAKFACHSSNPAARSPGHLQNAQPFSLRRDATKDRLKGDSNSTSVTSTHPTHDELEPQRASGRENRQNSDSVNADQFTLSRRPGRSSAGAMRSGRLEAARTYTPAR